MADTFAALLRDFRRAAGLTQQALASRSGISEKAIGALECGTRAEPYAHTVNTLAKCLGLNPDQHAALLRAARPVQAGTRGEDATRAGETAARPEPIVERHASCSGFMPAPLTGLIGREQHLDQVDALLGRCRLLTIVGPGGCGKTRLAIATAVAMHAQYAGGTWFIDLTACEEAAGIVDVIMLTLGVSQEAGVSPSDAVIAHLRPLRVLLVLDNCEHLLAACTGLACDLLSGCSGLTILCTSRMSLGLPGERILRCPPLPVPAAADTTPEQIAAYSSVQLLVQRAQAERPEFAITPENSAAVGEICRRLDGLPLALELAAARLSVLAPAQVAARLQAGTTVLSGARHRRPARHASLDATLAWSYDLLAPAEQAMLRSLAVFAPGWTLEAVEQVCGATAPACARAAAGGEPGAIGDPVHQAHLIGSLSRLVDASLVQAYEQEGAMRYRLLEIVRQFAREKLREAGEEASAHIGHFAFYCELAEGAAAHLGGPRQRRWRDDLDRELPNLYAALHWSVSTQTQGGKAVQLAGALWRYWWAHHRLVEGLGWLEEALIAGEGLATPENLARALEGAGNIATFQGRCEEASCWLEQCLALRRRMGDQGAIAAALCNIGTVRHFQGQHDQARSLFEESLAVRRAAGDQAGVVGVLNHLGTNELAAGRIEQAHTYLSEGVEQCHVLSDPQRLASLLGNLAFVSLYRHAYQEATAYFDGSVDLLRSLGDERNLAACLRGLAVVACAEHRPAQARKLLEESACLHEAAGAKPALADCLEAYALVAVGERRHVVAARLLGAAEALHLTCGAPQDRADAAFCKPFVDAAQEHLGDDDYQQEFAAGLRLSCEAALALGRREPDCLESGTT